MLEEAEDLVVVVASGTFTMKQVLAVLADRLVLAVVTEAEAMVVTAEAEVVGEQAEAWDLMLSLVEVPVPVVGQLH
jgi:hypothetical protein